jgi:hypothetical protein
LCLVEKPSYSCWGEEAAAAVPDTLSKIPQGQVMPPQIWEAMSHAERTHIINAMCDIPIVIKSKPYDLYEEFEEDNYPAAEVHLQGEPL